jgi:anaerobic magnesium-protoporphyrin IX monomethyl ester cyclase
MGRAHAHALQHPIGLCWLAAALRSGGFEPALIDFEVEKYDPVEFAALIKKENPLAVGFTAMTPTITAAAEMAAAAKHAAPDTVTIIGGAHASIMPLRTLEEYPALDVAATGDGEERIVKICAAAARGVLRETALPGCAVRAGDKIIDFTSEPGPPLDMDTLPMPARDLLKFELYRGASTPGIPAGTFRATELFTSRGCPGKCIFCCSDLMFGRRVRFRGIDHVMREVAECVERFNFNHFTIDDDTFTSDRNRALEFCERMAPLRATWDCDTRVDRIDEELVRAMAASGCKKIAFGVETGSPKILELIKKGITLEQVQRAFSITRRAGVMTCAFLMVGNHPEETRGDIERTWKFIDKLDPDLISVLLATPYPGTELYGIMRAENLIGDVPWSAYAQSFTAAPFSRTRTLPPEELKRLQSWLLRKFYLRPSYIARRLAALRKPGELRYWAGAGINFLRYLFQQSKS